MFLFLLLFEGKNCQVGRNSRQLCTGSLLQARRVACRLKGVARWRKLWTIGHRDVDKREFRKGKVTGGGKGGLLFTEGGAMCWVLWGVV